MNGLSAIATSFGYDIMRGESGNPNLDKLDQFARALKVERYWLLHGLGKVEGESPIVVDPDEVFVAIPHTTVRSSMGGGNVVESDPEPGCPYYFQRSWIKNGLRAKPSDLRIMHVEGDSMTPTLHDGDIVLIDTGRRIPTPPGIFCSALRHGAGGQADRAYSRQRAGSHPHRLG